MFGKKSLATIDSPTPFGLLRQMTSELDRMFDEPWSLQPLTLGEMPGWAPKIDVFEKDKQLIARVDLPGLKKEDVSVEVADGQLTLSGERKTEKEEKKNHVYRSEREYGSFYRAIPLPQGVKTDEVKATFANGVLEVTVPLPAAAVPTARKVAIKDAAPTATKSAA